MKKTIQIVVLAALCLNLTTKAQQPAQSKSPKNSYTGKVIASSSGEALPGAIIKINPSNQTLVTDDRGEFILNLPEGNYDLTVQYLNYSTKTVSVKIPLAAPLIIALDADEQTLQEVEILSTGYQNIPKERATGSFTIINNKTLNRSVSPDILSRLKGVTNGLLFDSNTDNSLGISVRGRSTILSNTTPLIVVDNFPFEGDLSTINPDIVESISVLKDAAAASIWGVRAGNGVIVITTKKGRLNTEPSVSFKTDVTLGGKPDLYYMPQLTSSQFIDVEQFLFDKGAYTATINNGYSTISPVVAILQKIKLDPGYAAQGKAEIDALRNIDYRDQLGQYFYRNSARQHHSADVKGGGKNQSYFFSAGYDKNTPSAVNLSDSRITLKGNNNYHLIENRLSVNTDITFSKSISENTNAGDRSTYLPYEQIADASGNALPIVINTGLRSSYTDTAGRGMLLDWKYRPLEELRNKYTTNTNKLTDYRLNLGINYKIVAPLSLSLNYQFYNANTAGESSYSKDSFYSRNLVNSYSQPNFTTGNVTRPIPIGDIYSPTFISNLSNYGRLQTNFSHEYNDKHAITAIAGFEIRDDSYKYNTYTLYGYVPETATNIQIDPVSLYPNYSTGNSSRIGSSPRQLGRTDRYISWYANGSYIYDNRYIVSGSYRKDESNLFGVKANQKGVPLWSVGASWNIDKEAFFDSSWLSSLQLKATYGYNGNVNKSISAYLTAEPANSTNTYTNTSFFSIVNPPNDNLRWERIKNVNLGLFFSAINERISGSVEYFVKDGIDLISTSPIAPQSGILLFTGNTANTHANGIDIQINSKNIDGQFKWNSVVIFNYVRDKITDYKVAVGTNGRIVNAATNYLAPLVNYPIRSVFAFQWAGLDPLTGNPQGVLDGSVSTDYAKIINSNDPAQLEFFGSATPTTFGAFTNTFSYKNVELSFNLTYKLGYYYKRSSISYLSLYAGGAAFRQPDYDLRWQKPGDELITDVPSAVYPATSNREDFYTSSATLIEKGDHIRLQDIQLNYSLSKRDFSKSPFANLNFYVYMSNFGAFWKANKQQIDPEFRSGAPAPRSIAFGIKSNF